MKKFLFSRRGRFIGRNIVNFPKSIFTYILRKCGIRLEIPWLSYSAVSEIKKFLNPKSKILEFGAGMSTIWFAKRGSKILSLEKDILWHRKIKNVLAKKGLSCSLLLCEDFSKSDELVSEKYDFILIDGVERDVEAKIAIKHLSKGGIVYLDNTDVDSRDIVRAREILDELIIQNGGEKRIFTDYAPGYLYVTEGTLYKIG